MATVLLVRHGRTAWNDERRMQGWAPVPLDETGREQAEALAAHLADAHDVDRLVGSDLERTRETAGYVADSVGVEPSFSEAWRERSVGVYQGLTYDDVAERFPDFGLTEDAAYAAAETPEAGESLVSVRDRVLDGWHDLRTALGDDETAVVVTHGGPIHLLLGHLKGMDVPESVLEHAQSNCAVNEVRVASEPRIVRENATPWA